jgi:hypothetical protein
MHPEPLEFPSTASGDLPSDFVAGDDRFEIIEWEDIPEPATAIEVPPEPPPVLDAGRFEEARQLSRHLRAPDAPRTKTGIVFWDRSFWHNPRAVAAALDAVEVSLCERVLNALPEGARAVPLDVETLFDQVSAVTEERQGGDVAWVFDLDVLLAKLPAIERERFWEGVFERLPHRARAVLLALPLLEDTPFAGSVMGDDVVTHPLGPSRAATLGWRDGHRIGVLSAGKGV